MKILDSSLTDIPGPVRRLRDGHLPRIGVTWRHLAAKTRITLLLRRVLHHRWQPHPQARHRSQPALESAVLPGSSPVPPDLCKLFLHRDAR